MEEFWLVDEKGKMGQGNRGDEGNGPHRMPGGTTRGKRGSTKGKKGKTTRGKRGGTNGKKGKKGKVSSQDIKGKASSQDIKGKASSQEVVEDGDAQV